MRPFVYHRHYNYMRRAYNNNYDMEMIAVVVKSSAHVSYIVGKQGK